MSGNIFVVGCFKQKLMAVISIAIACIFLPTYQYISFAVTVNVKETWLVSTSSISLISNQCVCCSISEVTTAVILQKLYFAKFCIPGTTCATKHNNISIAIFIVIMINNSNMVIADCCICRRWQIFNECIC